MKFITLGRVKRVEFDRFDGACGETFLLKATQLRIVFTQRVSHRLRSIILSLMRTTYITSAYTSNHLAFEPDYCPPLSDFPLELTKLAYLRGLTLVSFYGITGRGVSDSRLRTKLQS